jgi:hypothetical protein
MLVATTSCEVDGVVEYSCCTPEALNLMTFIAKERVLLTTRVFNSPVAMECGGTMLSRNSTFQQGFAKGAIGGHRGRGHAGHHHEGCPAESDDERC